MPISMAFRSVTLGFVLAAFSALGLSSCSRGKPPSEGPAPNGGAAAANPSGAAANAPNAADTQGAAGEGATSEAEQAEREREKRERLADPRWTRAMEDDEAAKQSLAQALGAMGLLSALDDGGEIRKAALAALPLADDAELALGPLARRVSKGEEAAPLVEAILGVAGKPATARDALDPEGAREAADLVLSLSMNESLPRETRALAISAARAFAEKKLVDSAKIPTSLDPP